MPIEIVIADDHAVVRDGIKSVIEKKAPDIVVVGEATNGREVVELSQKLTPDVYVIDIFMPVLNGIDTAEKLLRRNKKAKIIMISMYDNRTTVEKAVRSGARGYVLKESATEEIIKAIRDVHDGKHYLSPSIIDYAKDSADGKTSARPITIKTTPLTLKEREILQMIAEGHTSKDIAQKLNLSIRTVYVHRNNMMRKLDVHKQTDLVRYALKEGLAKL